jgi:hypothetical protein
MIAMGARSYIPQLGRFEQSDPQSGGSENSYAYAFGDPVGSADPSGESTITVTYNEETSAGGQAVAGLVNEWIAPGALMPKPVNLQIEAEMIAQSQLNAASAITVEWLGVIGGRGARAAGFIGEAWSWVKRNAKKLVAVAAGGVSTAVVGGVTLVSSIGCIGADLEFPEEFDCYKGAVAGATLTLAIAGVTVKAWSSVKENKP